MWTIPLIPAIVAILCLAPCAGQAASSTGPANLALIDDLSYPDDAAAQAAWRPMDATAGVSVARIDGRKALKMPCNFRGTKIERASWDRAVRLDLTVARGLQFQASCPDVSPIAQFSLYLRSGDGWYSATFSPGTGGGWGTCTISKDDVHAEGTPAGWGKIDTIRISAWRGGDTDTAFHIRDLTVLGGEGPILIVRGESVAKTAKSELGSVFEYSRSVAARFEELGLDYSVISDLDLTPERLKGIKLVILPHNPNVPDATAEILDKYLRDGGKMLAFYTLPGRLQAAAGISTGRHIQEKYRGYFASMRPAADSTLAGMPPVVGQMSWNVMEARTVEGRSRVAGQWYDKDGNSTGQAAIVASDNCVYMTHVLIPNDPVNKRKMLMAMAGKLVPELWETAAKASVDRIGRVGPYKDLADARKQTNLGPGSSHSAVFKMEEAEKLLAEARRHMGTGQFISAISAAEQANQLVLQAACMVQQPLKGEHRAFWCHSAFGVAGMEWDQAIKHLADNGFTAILPNMCWGGLAYYQSTVLPVAPEVKEKGDQVALCLAACRKYGLTCHVWKVNWNIGGRAPREFTDRMKAEARTQVGYSGKPVDWLCPSHPANQKLEIDSMVEVAGRYDVDGIHFDYIRYPGPEGCFCAGCRERFEKLIGSKVRNWPADVRQDAELRQKWLDFRRASITAVVAGVSEAVRKAKPKVKISAAVFGNWPADRDGVGQDWKLWCEKGYLDFVCPMDYTPHTGQFASLVERQVKWAGKVPCYPGIGLSTWDGKGDMFTLFDQIAVTRRAGTGGFTIFEYNASTAKDVVPLCGAGITRKE